MERNFTLLTDFYELTMMQGYLKSGKHKEKVIFDMFYRKNPCGKRLCHLLRFGAGG